jgi:hypothetical protein
MNINKSDKAIILDKSISNYLRMILNSNGAIDVDNADSMRIFKLVFDSVMDAIDDMNK